MPHLRRTPALTIPYAQRTTRCTSCLRGLVTALNARGGARLAHDLHVPASPTTLLRLVRRADVGCSKAKIIGVDDFAFRRGHAYGTIIVDLETHQPIDVLPDRSAQTLASWLRTQPEVETVVRDRSTEYAAGITDGRPEAQQILDRWHVLMNLRDALERWLARRYVIADAAPRRVRRVQVRSILDPFRPHLDERYDQGCRNIAQLLREVQAMGFTGTRTPVADWLNARRRDEAPRA